MQSHVPCAPFCMKFLLPAFLLLLLTACVSAQNALKEPEIEYIVSSATQIDPAKSLPEFTLYFASGTTVVHSYAFLKNLESLTGSYVVRMLWHYPNDFRPPMAQRVVTLSPGENVAQFSLHDGAGLQNGPYLLDVRAGKDEMNLTASGSARFFIGMTPEEAETYLVDEAEYKKKWEEDRAKREAEQEKVEAEKRALEEKLGWEKRLEVETGTGGAGVFENSEEQKETKESKEKKETLEPPAQDGEEELPPAL